MSIVLGLGFGDEGKGLTTSFLTSQTRNPLIVRFNGGHQAGHTVVHNGHRHVFSSFGSGTLQGAETFWSRFCTVYPIAFMNEYKALPEEVRKKVRIKVDRLCPVTIPLDLDTNHLMAVKTNHGSVGAGFGATIDRCEKHYGLYVQDLMFDHVWKTKFLLIAKYLFENNLLVKTRREDIDDMIDRFSTAVSEMSQIIDVVGSKYLQEGSGRTIFEGAQGILLDQNFGFFPHVTRSNTTSQNALELDPWHKDIYYVTRCYQTRHGNGPMTNEKVLKLKNNQEETNVLNQYQGQFRVGNLDLDFLKYALTCDGNFSTGLRKNLVITCTDQLDVDVEFIHHELLNIVKFDKVFISDGPSYQNIKEI